MTVNVNKYFERAMKILEAAGLLQQRGMDIADLCRIVTPDPIKGSWWGNPSGQQIFTVSEMLADHPDVTVTKLVSAKVTFVHRSLWPKLIAAGRARDDWQTQGLSSEAKLLLREIDKSGTIRTDELGPKFGKKPGTTALELELRLLIHSEQFHTETGYHTRLLETWDAWAKRMKLRSKAIESWRARHFFEKRVAELNEEYGGPYGHPELPWQSKKLLKVKRT
jgi:hypothetical protein